MKHMKKSMFITTLIMTVVLVVALSTATFAWYTANTAVGATEVSVTSANSTTASLVIDNQLASANDTRTSVDLTMTNAQSANVPMVYASAGGEVPVVDTTTYTDFVSKFVTFTRDADGKFASPVTTATPDVISEVSGSNTLSPSDYIVLTNVGGGSMATLSTRVTIKPFYVYTTVASPVQADIGNYYEKVNNEYVLTEDTTPGAKTYYTRSDGNNYLRVAVFASTTSNGTYLLKGIYGAGSTTQIANRTNLMDGSSSAVTVGTTVINTAVGGATFALTTSGTAVTLATTIASGSAIYVKVAVWFEGNSMQNADANQVAAFSMSFGA